MRRDHPHRRRRSRFLVFAGAAIALDETECSPLRRILLVQALQIDPDCCAGRGVAQLDLGRPHARRCKPDDTVGPAVVGDGVSDQHVPQFASPQGDVDLSFGAHRPRVNSPKVWVLQGTFSGEPPSRVKSSHAHSPQAAPRSNIGTSMLRRGLGLAAILLVFAAPARAGTLGLAEVRSADGTLLGKAGAGAYSYPADGSILRIGWSRVTAARV